MEYKLRQSKTQRMVMTALMMSLILLGTMMFKIPVPMTQGYIHLGDAMIYLAVILLGKKDGTIAAAFGSALGDILGGYAFWAPWTLIVKGLMALITAMIIERADRTSTNTAKGITDLKRVKHTRVLTHETGIRIAGMIVGGIVMSAGYLIVERFIYGNWATAVIAVPWNVIQFAVGIAVAIMLSKGLERVAK